MRGLFLEVVLAQECLARDGIEPGQCLYEATNLLRPVLERAEVTCARQAGLPMPADDGQQLRDERAALFFDCLAQVAICDRAGCRILEALGVEPNAQAATHGIAHDLGVVRSQTRR